MERLATPGSPGLLVIAVFEALAIPGFCAWVAVTRPHHVVGAIATLLALAAFWLLVSLQVAAVSRVRRGARAGAAVDVERQLARVRDAAAQLGAGADVSRARVVEASRGALYVTRLRATRAGVALYVNPQAVAERDDASLLGMLALQVAVQRRLRTRRLALLVLGLVALMLLAPLLLTVALTGDVALGWAVGAGAGAALWAVVSLPLLLWLFGARRMAGIDGEAARIAGSPDAVARAVEAGAEDDRRAREARTREASPLLWPATVFFAAAARWGEDVRQQRIDRLRRGDLPSA